MFDTLIINGSIVDGTGDLAYKADIGIKDGKIAAIGHLSSMESTEVIDAKNSYVCPGFIDVHTHSDSSMFADGRMVSQVRQGVTTQISGLCGVSLAPLTEDSAKMISKLSFFEVGEPTWDTFDSYLKTLDTLDLGTNMGSLTGHGLIRLAVMKNPIGDPSPEELNAMAQLLDECIQAGSFGLSTGLEYNPGKASEISELEVLCRVIAKHNALHTCHTRNRDKHYVSAIQEVLDATRATGARLQISHINPKYGRHESTMEDLLDMMEHARAQGFYVAADVMPSEWNHTSAMANMPLWAQNLPADEFLALLNSTEGRAKLKENPSPIWQLVAQEKWDRVYHFGGKNTVASLGQSIEEIAKARNCSGWDAICHLMAEEAPNFALVMLTSNAFSLDDIALALQDPYSSVVSDVVGLAKDGALAGKIFSPNTYDWMTVFFKNFVIGDEPLFTFEEGIQKLTAIPAMQFNIPNRGMLKVDYHADITIINPEELKTTATLKDPCQYPSGVKTVLVNGKIAYQEGSDVIHCHGKVIRFKGE